MIVGRILCEHVCFSLYVGVTSTAGKYSCCDVCSVLCVACYKIKTQHFLQALNLRPFHTACSFQKTFLCIRTTTRLVNLFLDTKVTKGGLNLFFHTLCTGGGTFSSCSFHLLCCSVTPSKVKVSQYS